MSVARHTQITQNNKFSFSLQYLKKKWVMKLIFCMQISMKISYKLIQWFLMGTVNHSQSSKIVSLQFLYFIAEIELRDEVDFLHADKDRSFLQVDFNTLSIKVSNKAILSLLMGMIKHSQSTQSKKLAMSLQHLKKECRDGVHFLHADSTFSTSWHYRFWWKWPDMSKVLKIGSW